VYQVGFYYTDVSRCTVNKTYKKLVVTFASASSVCRCFCITLTNNSPCVRTDAVPPHSIQVSTTRR